MTLTLFIIGAFFAYGMYTIQRPGFFAEPLRSIFKRLPEKLHEPFFSCGVCVSSVWGLYYLASTYYAINHGMMILLVPNYLVALAGFCAILDRSVKFFEYGYRYNYLPKNPDYTYLSSYISRNRLTTPFVVDAIQHGRNIVEIGGFTEWIKNQAGEERYLSYDLEQGRIIKDECFGDNYFVLIKGLCFEGQINNLISILANAKGFIIESSISGTSGTQVNYILDAFDQDDITTIPFKINAFEKNTPAHCAGNVSDRILIIKHYKHR